MTTGAPQHKHLDNEHILPRLGILDSADRARLVAARLDWAWSAFRDCTVRVTTKDGNAFDARYNGIGQVDDIALSFPAVLHVTPLRPGEEPDDIPGITPSISIPLSFVDRIDLY